jgi:hypothetical protein
VSNSGQQRQRRAAGARIGFAKPSGLPARGDASFPSFARLCIARQLATAMTAAMRAKHRALNEVAQGEAAVYASWTRLGGQNPRQRRACPRTARRAQTGRRLLMALVGRVLAHPLLGWSRGEAAHRFGVLRESADNVLPGARRRSGSV